MEVGSVVKVFWEGKWCNGICVGEGRVEYWFEGNRMKTQVGEGHPEVVEVEVKWFPIQATAASAVPEDAEHRWSNKPVSVGGVEVVWDEPV